ncbi:MAG: helix-turn-helix domain-containing protein [Candidatus Anstonellaceae archaeon]
MRREYDRLPGRPRKLTDEEMAMAINLYYNEGMPVREVAEAMKVSHMTIWRAIARAGTNGAFDRLPLDTR